VRGGPLTDLDLSIFVEFGVGIAGFSGVVVAFGRGSGRLGDYDRFRVVQLLLSSLTPAFFGVLPTILAGFGIRGEPAARAASGALMATIVILTTVALVSERRMSARAREHLSPAVWRISLVSSAVLFVWNALNLAGSLGPVSLGPVILGMTWLLFMASLMFFRLLLVRVGDDDDA